VRQLRHITLVMVLLGFFGCSSRDKPTEAPEAAPARDYNSTELYVASVDVRDRSASGSRLDGIKTQTRSAFLSSTRSPSVVIEKTSRASIQIDVKNQCTQMSCFLVIVVHFSFPDPEGFNHRYREQAIAAIDGTRYAKVLPDLCATLRSGLHLWRTGIDVTPEQLKSWITYKDRDRLKEGLRVIRDRGVTELAPAVFDVFADPAGSYNIDAAWTASVLISEEHIPHLVKLASSLNPDIAVPAVKSLGMSGLATHDMLTRIERSTKLNSVRVEAQTWLENTVGSSDTESSGTRK
jgi:hypothetical protein